MQWLRSAPAPVMRAIPRSCSRALLAGGATNREIGARLFMAEKTASVHVSRILSKLEVENRVEAATAAQRLGIVP